MQSENLHLSDQDLLLAADGELETRRAAQVRAHLAACWNCRARMAEIEETIADFARAHREALDPKLPPIDGPRALLRAQLAELAAASDVGLWRRFLQFTSPTPVAAVRLPVAFRCRGGRHASGPAFRAACERLSGDHSRLWGGSQPRSYTRGHASGYGRRRLLDGS